MTHPSTTVRRAFATTAGAALVLGCSSSPDLDDGFGAPSSVPATGAVTVEGSGPGAVTIPPTSMAAVAPVGPEVAAVEIVEWKQELISMSVTDAEAGLRRIVHPGHVEEIVASTVGDLRRRDEVAPAGLTLRVAVIELVVLKESADAATVSLWTVEIVTGAGSTRVTYNTTTLELGLVDGWWLLMAENTTPGPVPTPTQEPFAPSAFETALTGFSDPGGR